MEGGKDRGVGVGVSVMIVGLRRGGIEELERIVSSLMLFVRVREGTRFGPSVADLERSLGKMLCEHMLDFLATYAVYIHELPPSFSVFVSHYPSPLAPRCHRNEEHPNSLMINALVSRRFRPNMVAA